MNCEDLPLPGGPVVGFLCFHCRGHRSDLSLDSSACQGMAKKFKTEKKNFFLRCKTKPVKIWVTAESLLCGHWCEDREAGWGLSHLSVQTHLRMFPLSFPLHDLHPQSWVCFSEIQGFIFTLPFTDEVRSPQRLKILIRPEVIWWIYSLQNCLHSDDMCKVRHILSRWAEKTP